MATSGTSGQKHDIINPRERAVSVDINRLQQFVAANRSEFYRWMLDAMTEQDDTGGGVVEQFSVGGENPMRAYIMNGILPRPQTGLGNVDLFFDPGVIFAISPDAVPNPDDSPGKLVVEPGLTTPGVVVLTPNAAGATRIDVIEASVIEEVIETDSRDVFDPTTGLFTAVTVDKVQRSRLAYRVRLGVAGGGFPGTVSGWVPLAVTIVPNGTLQWDDVTLFDVRPIVSDRVRPPFNVFAEPRRRTCTVRTDITVYPAQTKLLGYVEAAYSMIKAGKLAGAYWAGGALHTGDVDTGIDVANAVNQEPGFVVTGNTVWHLYALFPFGLPRWVRYASTAGGRLPDGMRGIPVVSATPPGPFGDPFVAINFPAIYGFAGATSAEGVLLVAGATKHPAPFHLAPVMSERNSLTFYGRLDQVSAISVASAPAATGNLAIFTFLVGTHYPANATELDVLLTVGLINTNGATTISHIFPNIISADDGTSVFWSSDDISIGGEGAVTVVFPETGGNNNLTLTRRIKIPIHALTPTVVITWNYQANAGGGAFTGSGSSANIAGWKLGLED